ncbi:unnamed protein product [Diabrotica balteata]|uniref:Uncharacterized protein n=1 Tax=Diabrotica balteata TaxID=107213 RepID=A0A9N9XCB0_DIABA|nr:unnamed protein product [Diabrotica balteata]
MSYKNKSSVSSRTKLLVSLAVKGDGITSQSENFEDRSESSTILTEVNNHHKEVKEKDFYFECKNRYTFEDNQVLDIENLPITIEDGDIEIPILESFPIETSENVEIFSIIKNNEHGIENSFREITTLDDISVEFQQYIPTENEKCQTTESMSKGNETEKNKNSAELKEIVEDSTIFQEICGSDADYTYSDPDWLPDSKISAKRPKLMKIDIISKSCSAKGQKDSTDDVASTLGNVRTYSETHFIDDNENAENPIEAVEPSKYTKRIKGIRKRENEKLKKNHGLDYKNRKGKLFSSRTFKPVEKCCIKRKCNEKITSENQRKIFNDFYTLPVCARDQALADRIRISTPAVSRKKEDTCETRVTHDRLVTVSYYVTLDGTTTEICKTMFIGVFGLSRGKVDVIIQKVKASSSRIIQGDMRGKHPQQFKTTSEEIEDINAFIDRYPRHESHYARRDSSSKKVFLPSNLNVKIMYKEYCEHRNENGHTKSACYDVFRKQFNAKGYKFKEPFIDTCNKCDEFILKKRHSTNKSDRQIVSDMHDSHIKEAQEGYDMKNHDKNLAKYYDNRVLLVFDLQQVLPVPYLSSNIAYYKRFLSMYNLTIRNCSNDQDSSYCCMWSEIDAGRGSDEIASCVFKKIMDLPNNIEYVTTYSDTCGGQNRNINIAAMFCYVLTKKKTIQVIDQKFLLPGHTRLECDSDHARIERAKKILHSSVNKNSISDTYRIMVPRDWCQFVRTLSGRKKFKVIEMQQLDFKEFSSLLKNVLVHRKTDSEKQKVEWLKIRWLRYTQDFGQIYFKYDLNPFSPFKSFSILRGKKGRPENLEVARSYAGPLPINPKKKKDLLSMFSLIDPQFHSFYKKLTTDTNSREFDELDELDEEDKV